MAAYNFKLKFTADKEVNATIDTSANEVAIIGTMPALTSAEYDLCNSLISALRSAVGKVAALEEVEFVLQT